jgi:proteasome accessory factor C
MTTASEQLRRILHLIPTLSDGETHPIGEVAREAGVDRATLLKDIESISERFEVPGGFVEGLQIYIEADTISVVPNHFLRPMRLTKGELCALELGLAMLRAERPPEEHRAIDSARKRLQSVIAKLPTEEIGSDLRTAALSVAGDLEHLRLLRQAFREHRKVRLSYRKAADQDARPGIICPYGIVFASGMWYAVAHDEGADGVRIFRLDRIQELEPLDAHYDSPRDFSIDTIVRDGKAFQADRPSTLRVRYSPRIARWIAEREGKPLEGNGALVLELPLADIEWAVRHVLQYGPDVDVLEPEQVRLELQQRLKKMNELVL